MFEIKSRGSTVAREILGGVTTFMAMSYILFVQPAVLAKAGMDPGGVFMATCISSAAACLLMGILANYPIALAPGMGENFFFVTLCTTGVAVGALKFAWTEALALTAICGVIFVLLSLVGFRSKLLNAIPDALKSGIAAGIGLFIALIGFEWGDLITSNPATFVALKPLRGNYVAALTLTGLAVILVLQAFRVRGAILLSILITTVLTGVVGYVWDVPGVSLPENLRGIVDLPSGLGQTAGKLWGGFPSVWEKLLSKNVLDVIAVAFILLFMDLFDTVGTLVGVSKRAGLMQNGRLPRAERALFADAAGTVVGAGLGTSTVTSYIESITGVQSGARTGLAALVAGACMLVALFFQPIVRMVSGGIPVGTYPWGDPILRYPMIAPALIFVGAMMIRAVRDVKWDDMTEALPAFLTMVAMPFAYSISAGIAIGFVSYAAGKLLTGRVRQCPLIVYIFAILFVVQYLVAS